MLNLFSLSNDNIYKIDFITGKKKLHANVIKWKSLCNRKMCVNIYVD